MDFSRLLPRPPAFASRGRGRAHRVFHPLCGARLDTLVASMLRGGIAPERAHVAALALATAAVRVPFTSLEAAAARALPRDYPAPVFVIGHWRSGTTHLSNLLTRSGSFGLLSPAAVGLPAEPLAFGRLMAPLIGQFMPATRLIDRMSLGPDLPQEDELAMANLSTLSCQHGVYFPTRLRREFARGVFGDGVGARAWAGWSARLERYVRAMTWRAGGRRLLIRNPANSARIPILLAIWPDARFIHIHREPGAVYASSVRMFTTLVRELSLGRPEADVRGLVRWVYPRLMRRVLSDGRRLEAGRIATVTFERLRSDPVGTLRDVHDGLELPGFEAGRGLVAEYVRGLSHEPGSYELRDDDREWLARECQSIGAALGYREPAEGWGSAPSPAGAGVPRPLDAALHAAVDEIGGAYAVGSLVGAEKDEEVG
jgi:hypothetical protein